MEWRIVLLLILFKLLASINLYMDSALKRGTAFWEGELIGWHSSNQQSRILSWPAGHHDSAILTSEYTYYLSGFHEDRVGYPAFCR